MLASLTGSAYWMVAGWTMLHFLWVGSLIGLIAAVGSVVLRKAQPIARYTFALVCLAALAVAPAIIGLTVAAAGKTSIDSLHPSEAAQASDVMLGLAPEPAVEPVFQWLPGNRVPLHKADRYAAIRAASRATAHYLPWAWLVGAPLMFAVAATGLAGAKRLRNQSQPLAENSPAATICRELLNRLNISRKIAVAACDRIGTPVLIGIVRPVILLPPAALMGMSSDQLEMILLHELAHVRRWDNLVNLLQRAIESLLFFHPVVWMVSNWVRREREHCCDEAVLAHTQRPRAYAEMLAAMACPDPSRLVLVAMGEANVVTRIRRVLHLHDESLKPSHKAVGVILSLFVTGALLIGISAQHSAAAHTADPTVPSPTASTENKPDPADAVAAQAVAKDVISLRVVDSRGAPVAGAHAGIRAKVLCASRTAFFCWRQEPDPMIASDNGRLQFSWDWLARGSACAPLIIMQEKLGIGAIVPFTAADRGQERTVTLQPLTRVHYQLESSTLQSMGMPLSSVKAQIFFTECCQGGFIIAQDRNRVPNTNAPFDIEFLLPPGQYQTYSFSDEDGRAEACPAATRFEVQPGQRQLELGMIDLSAAPFSLLYGRPAPEFIGVRDLKTGEPVQLADYQGKVVVVYFPLAFTPGDNDLRLTREVYDRFHDKGLEVIMIRSPDGNSSAQATDVPFIDAVDSGDVGSPGSKKPSPTAAAYGLGRRSAFFLIGRDGRMLQRIRPERDGTRALIERTLEASGQP